MSARRLEYTFHVTYLPVKQTLIGMTSFVSFVAQSTPQYNNEIYFVDFQNQSTPQYLRPFAWVIHKNDKNDFWIGAQPPICQYSKKNETNQQIWFRSWNVCMLPMQTWRVLLKEFNATAVFLFTLNFDVQQLK